VDVVGLQGHISLYGPSVDDFRRAIERFAALGVKVQVTELDVSVYRSPSEPRKDPTPELLADQGRRYAELFAMFRQEAAAGRLDMVVLWGTADDDTWLDNFPVMGRPDAPLLFDRNLQAKPAFWAVVDPSAVR
jgi:endo-1,4-beta-xylanase